MKKLLSTNLSIAGTGFALLLLRIVAGAMMIAGHGYPKMLNFQQIVPKFMSFMGLGPTVSLSLAIFAEFFCSLALILGLFTRFALIPLIITASVIVFMANDGAIVGKGELGFMYLAAYVVLFITGPGKFSVDAMISRK